MIFPDLQYRSELVWSLLLFAGYLTYESCALVEGKKQCSLKIPNQEIKYLYIGLLQELFKTAVMGGQVNDLIQSIIEGNTAIFSKLLQSFVANSMSFYDLPSNEPEKSYHLFVLGLLVTLNNQYYVKSNRESGLGRYDILLVPKQHDLPGIIIEFKVVLPGDSLESTADLALDQIIKKKYAQELHELKAASIIAYGIAFEGKSIFIKSVRL